MSKNDPAFPLTEDAVNFKNKDFPMQGLTKLEWFAGMAMLGMLSNQYLTERYSTKGIDIAKEAFGYAQDMLVEAEKQDEV